MHKIVSATLELSLTPEAYDCEQNAAISHDGNGKYWTSRKICCRETTAVDAKSSNSKEAPIIAIDLADVLSLQKRMVHHS